MATRKPRRTASSRKPRATERKRTAAPKAQRRRRTPETLRLRTIEPTLTANDLERSVRFYTDTLGFIMGERHTEGGVLRGVMLKAGVCTLGLSQDDWSKGRDRKKGEGMRLWFETAQDIDALAERVKAGGGRVTQGPKDESWGARSVWLDDPDGFHLTFYRMR